MRRKCSDGSIEELGTSPKIGSRNLRNNLFSPIQMKLGELTKTTTGEVQFLLRNHEGESRTALVETIAHDYGRPRNSIRHAACSTSLNKMTSHEYLAF